jgi:predicted DNA binding CopG/RHH family protein
MKKKIPLFKTDEEAERFTEEADLTQYDLSGLRPMRFELRPKDVTMNMRVPGPLLDRFKARAKAHNIPYTRLLRQLMERAVSRR